MGVFMVALVVGAASVAVANVPDLGLSTATMATTGQTLSLFNLPDGGGNPLTQAYVVGGGGALVDATITLTLKDGLGNPIQNYPFEDLTLSCDDGLGQAMAPCVGGVSADGNTNAAGQTTFSGTLRAGGWAEASTDVMVAGAALTSGGVALQMNSADMNGDGSVAISDVSLFSGVYYGAYSYAADFNADGAVAISDVSLLAGGNGTACP
jgi:hypothetical protein